MDRVGSAILEFSLRREDDLIPWFHHINLKEIVDVTCWYLWRMRRCRAHNGEVPSLFKCKMSILVIIENVTNIYLYNA
jgi:hypothetical protein